ncbi:MAG: protein kinase [Candidatus Riflebacteria bacterium]|nr:protein kinase [Candidatus Riflebacteria bacterium]
MSKGSVSSNLCPTCGQPGAPMPEVSSLLMCTGCAVAFVPDGARSISMFTTVGGLAREAGKVDLPESFRKEYAPIRVLGSGAMGTVYLATEIATGNLVAIKFQTGFFDADGLQRFLQEGQLMTRINHPNVVRVAAVHAFGNTPCLVCEYVDGGSLRTWMLCNSPAGFETAAGLMGDILSGLEACHSWGVVHRDLKPENVLLTGSGQAKIADLGLAKHFGRQGPALTAFGTVLGTPRYMAPEQSRGELVTIASDIYAAGLVFYELLAGRPAWSASSIRELHEKRLNQTPTPIGELVADLPPGVSDLLGRVLSLRVADRPATAEIFRAAILQCLKTPVPSRSLVSAAAPPPVTTAAPARPAAGGRPSPAVRTAAVAVAMSAAVLLAGLLWIARPGDPVAQPIHSSSPSPSPAPTGPASPRSGVRRPVAAASAGPAGPLASASRPATDRYGDALPAHAVARIGTTRLRHGRIVGLSFSPDARLLASVSETDTVELWEVATGRPTRRLRGSGCVAFAPQGGSIAVGGSNAGLRIHHLDSPAPQPSRAGPSDMGGPSLRSSCPPSPHPARPGLLQGGESPCRAVAYSPDGSLVAAVSSDRTIRIWETATSALLHELPAERGEIVALSFDREARSLIVASARRRIRQWDSRTGQLLREVAVEGESIVALAFRSQSRALVMIHADGTARTVELATGRARRLWSTGAGPTPSAAVPVLGRTVVVAVEPARIEARDLSSGRSVWAADAGDGPRCVTMSPDGSIVAAVCGESRIGLWRTLDGAPLVVDGAPARPVAAAGFSAGSGAVVTGDGGGAIRVWDASTGEPRGVLADSGPALHSLAVAPGGALVATGHGDGQVRLWELETRAMLRQVTLAGGPVRALALSPDGTRLACGWNGGLRIVDRASLRTVVTMPTREAWITSLDFSRDGRRLAATTMAGWLHLFEAATGRELLVLEQPGLLRSVAFSADGKTVACGGLGDLVRVRDATTGAVLFMLEGSGGVALSLAISPDGRLVASGHDDGVVRLWAAGSDRELARLTGHRGAVTALCFSSDGRALLSASDDTTAVVWRVP